MKVKVTVGLCVKNSERTVKESIESIINQNYPNELMEIVVVDGNSGDETISIVHDAISETNIRTKVYSDEGKGLGYARQMVVHKGDGKYIVFVDGDVELLNGFMEKQVEFMEKNQQVAVAIGNYMFREGTLIATLQNLYSHTLEYGLGNDATIYRAEALRAVGGFDKNIKGAAEDKDIIVTLQARGWKLSRNDEAKFYHNPRENWRAFCTEQKWFGYGDHYFRHKHKIMKKPLLHKVPLVTFAVTLRVAVKAYKLSHQKKSFFIPFLFSLAKIPWWLGFVESHFDGYGHAIS